MRPSSWLTRRWHQGLERQPDIVFATSLLGFADLMALLPRDWRETRRVLYMHENQIAYPAATEDPVAAQRDAHFALTNLSSILAADLVIWNSHWNLRSFMEGIQKLLGHAPDGQVAGIPERIAGRSRVIWPPVEPPPNSVCGPRDEGGGIRVLWPHRWEHDKGPDELLQIARSHTQSLGLRWTILGQRFRRVPDSLQTFLDEFASHIDHAGYLPDRAAYWDHVSRCNWVLSTANHEFFGIAVVEALLAGCLPWLPDRLSYPELLPESAQGLSPLRPPGDVASIRAGVRRHLASALAGEAVRRLDRALEEAGRVS